VLANSLCVSLSLSLCVCALCISVIGCEFATIFANFGRTNVHLLNNKKARLLPDEDADLSALVSANLEARGVNILNNTEFLSVNANQRSRGVTCELRDIKSGKQYTRQFDTCLLSIGRVPNVSTIGLERIGVEIDRRSGGIVTDGHARSSVGNIYAVGMARFHCTSAKQCIGTEPSDGGCCDVGDATADIGLVNVGEMEARHAIESIFLPYVMDRLWCWWCARLTPAVLLDRNNIVTPLSYLNIASIMFLEPEVACIGLCMLRHAHVNCIID
jgi:dihydrolipoamide dehydrogenase